MKRAGAEDRVAEYDMNGIVAEVKARDGDSDSDGGQQCSWWCLSSSARRRLDDYSRISQARSCR